MAQNLGITQKKSLKEIIAEEYKKCATDPIHFMKKYCMIQHPVRGKIPFHLFPFQEKTLTEFKNNRFNIVLIFNFTSQEDRHNKARIYGVNDNIWIGLANQCANILEIPLESRPSFIDGSAGLAGVRAHPSLFPIKLRRLELQPGNLLPQHPGIVGQGLDS